MEILNMILHKTVKELWKSKNKNVDKSLKKNSRNCENHKIY